MVWQFLNLDIVNPATEKDCSHGTETSWGRGSSSHTVQCEINYLEKAANFKICFGDNFQTCVNSAQSATDAANAYLKVGFEYFISNFQKVKNPNTKAKLSRVHVFCLNGQELERNHEKKHRTSFHKPFNELTINCFHPGDNPVLQEIHFSIQGKNNFQVNFEAQDIEKENQRNEAFTKSFHLSNQLKYIGKLLFIIPGLVKKHILNPDHNVGRKVKHVMVTCAVLDDISNIYKADFHYTTILYPGVENYEILQKVMEPMINELHNLVTNGLIDSNGIKWRIEPYFSSDLKFLTIILGFNAANANYFCPWCLCMKKDIGNKEKAYKIEKNMDQLQTPNPPPGHLKVPLLPMIPLNNYVPDELHVMLRIWN
nr:9403_t:CDS:2 [Entrophospora candida]